MPFVPNYSQWVGDRMTWVPLELKKYCGDLDGFRVLNVGCGDMLADLGFLSLGPRHITGLDVLDREWDVVEHAAGNARREGFPVPEDYRSRLAYKWYEGRHFPFEENAFDLVICWGAFEHIADVPAALREMKRVVKHDGKIFAVVYPWYHTFTGNHLTDFIDEPFFQFTRDDAWVYRKLNEYLDRYPEAERQKLAFFGPEPCPMRKFLLEIMWPEYKRLNRYSARMFMNDIAETGLLIEQLQNHLDVQHLHQAPDFLNPIDVCTAGTTVLLRPAPSPRL